MFLKKDPSFFVSASPVYMAFICCVLCFHGCYLLCSVFSWLLSVVFYVFMVVICCVLCFG